MANQEQVLKRREEIAEMIAQGNSRYDVTTKLKISSRMYFRDIHAIRTKQAKEIENISKSDLVATLQREAFMRKKHLWMIFNEPEHKLRDRLTALTLIQKEDELTMRRMSFLGMGVQIENVNIQQDVTNNIMVINSIIKELEGEGLLNKTNPLLSQKPQAVSS